MSLLIDWAVKKDFRVGSQPARVMDSWKWENGESREISQEGMGRMMYHRMVEEDVVM